MLRSAAPPTTCTSIRRSVSCGSRTCSVITLDSKVHKKWWYMLQIAQPHFDLAEAGICMSEAEGS